MAQALLAASFILVGWHRWGRKRESGADKTRRGAASFGGELWFWWGVHTGQKREESLCHNGGTCAGGVAHLRSVGRSARRT